MLLQSVDPTDPTLPTDAWGWLLLLGGFVLFVALVVAAVVDLRRAVGVYRTDPVPIAEAVQGETVEIEGTVEAVDDPLVAPLTGNPAVAYDYSVEVERHSSRRSRYSTLDWGTESTRLLVDDGTGTALVDPESARVQYGTTARAITGASERPPEDTAERIDVDPSLAPWSPDDPVAEFDGSGLFDREVRYTENWIEVGDEVHVRGRALSPRAADGPVDARPTVAFGVVDAGPVDRIRAALPGVESGGGSRPIVSAGEERAAFRQLLGSAASDLAYAVVLGAFVFGFMYGSALPVGAVVRSILG